MCSKTLTRESIFACSDKIRRLAEALSSSDAVVVGAGAGLSAAAGYEYSGERFEKSFSDFEAKYGFHDMYSGGFYPYDTEEEYWAYWSRYIMINRYEGAPRPLYESLLRLLCGKEYFVITTNVDHCFQRAGFDKRRLFYTQGDYGLFQCTEPCCAEVWDNEAAVREMYLRQKNMRIPSRLIPRCPRCGRRLTMNLRSDDRFVEDAGWHRAAGNYRAFLEKHLNDRVLFLELGVGYNTPVIIKYPFWQMAAQNPNAVYACINSGEAYAPPEIKERSICLGTDIFEAVKALLPEGGGYEA